MLGKHYRRLIDHNRLATIISLIRAGRREPMNGILKIPVTSRPSKRLS